MEVIQTLIIDFLKINTIKIACIIVLYVFGKIILRIIIKKLVKLADDGDDKSKSTREKRAGTLGRIGITTGNILIYCVILFMALSIFGVDIRPILAGAGIIGLAIGFGAQSLVKDFVSGLYILIENQYAIGDKVKIGSSEGRVIAISLRSTILRDDEGKTYYISNGSINNLINYSK
jgi:small conductance mechanosensitive channel